MRADMLSARRLLAVDRYAARLTQVPTLWTDGIAPPFCAPGLKVIKKKLVRKAIDMIKKLSEGALKARPARPSHALRHARRLSAPHPAEAAFAPRPGAGLPVRAADTPRLSSLTVRCVSRHRRPEDDERKAPELSCVVELPSDISADKVQVGGEQSNKILWRKQAELVNVP